MDDRSPAERSRTMAAVRSRDTTPERLVRSALHRTGIRFRLRQKVALPTRTVTPDLVFRGARVAVFIDGCYWHGCPEHCRMPTSNRAYWTDKIERNRERDRRTDAELLAAGWAVLRHWEHEAPDEVARAVATALGRGVDGAAPAGPGPRTAQQGSRTTKRVRSATRS